MLFALVLMAHPLAGAAEKALRFDTISLSPVMASSPRGLPAVRSANRVVRAGGRGVTYLDRESIGELVPTFRSGERLRFRLTYLRARGAEADFTVEDTLLNGRPGYHLKVDGHSRGLIGRLYPIHDVYHSYTMADTHLPVRAIRDVHEQDYKDYKVDLFDRSRPDSTVLTRENGDQHVLPRGVNDILSQAYYLRSRLPGLALQKGDRIELAVFHNGEYDPMTIRYMGVERIKTRFGWVDCLLFVPTVQKGNLFEDNDALHIWISADANHIPMRIRFRLFLGSMYTDLISYKNLLYPLQTHKKAR